MPYILGIDTGGTYTDGVVIDAFSKSIVKKAKAETTRKDLTVGIGHCLDSLQFDDFSKIKLVCVSTTLATNAIVEGRGGRAGLFLIGDPPEEKIPAHFIRPLSGKLDIKGKEIRQIDQKEVMLALEDLKQSQADAIAVSGYASVRNPAQELYVKKMIQDTCKIPVVCAHELSSSLGFADRTVTAVLNARLIPIVEHLIGSIMKMIKKFRIDARVMIVKGDGSLMDQAMAMEKPIETILSGPAASVIGGIFLTGSQDAMIVDIGGTTTDIATVENGKVRINDSGARVGGWQTQVRAARINTFGLGGDSCIKIKEGNLIIGPRKVRPLCRAGQKHPHLLSELKMCETQADKDALDPECYIYLNSSNNDSLNGDEKTALALLKDEPHSLYWLAKKLGKPHGELDLSRLVSAGILEKASVTPTDILHELGVYKNFDVPTAKTGISILAARAGLDRKEFAVKAYNCIIKKLALACSHSAEDHKSQKSSVSARYDAAKNKGEKKIDKPIIAIGAPADAWTKDVCKKLNTQVIVPLHAEVANAVGAAVGQVMETAKVLIRPGREHIGFIMHAPFGLMEFDELKEAVDYAVPMIKQYVAQKAAQAGSSNHEVVLSYLDVFTEESADKKTYIETQIKATAVGSPEWH